MNTTKLIPRNTLASNTSRHIGSEFTTMEIDAAIDEEIQALRAGIRVITHIPSWWQI
jgi:hypothetical protein